MKTHFKKSFRGLALVAGRRILFSLLVGSAILSAFAQNEDEGAPLPVPMTVSDAVFRSRWIGVQVDSGHKRSAAGMQGLQAEPGLFAPLENVANTLRDGLSLGPLEINPGVAFGWEYSNVNSTFQSTSPSDDNSFFISPNLAVSYNREIGNWSVTAAYGGGFNYYFNPEYTAAGTSSQRNPFFNTASIGIGYLTSRQKINLQLLGSYGTGLNVITGENTTTADLSANLHWEHILTAYSNIGAHAAYSTSLNSFLGVENSNDNADLSSASAGAYADWFATGKTRVRFELSAGQDTQGVSNESTANRSYMQGILSVKYKFTDKFDLDGGAGARYVEDPKVVDPKYAGFLPSFFLRGSYRPTEKTGISAGVSLLGNDIQPSFDVTAFWQPRVNTSLTLSVYQGQGFSYTVSEQVQVSRGAVLSLNQKLFSRMNILLSAGWQQTENLSLSDTGPAEQESGETSSYGFAMGTLQWNFTDWAYWQGQLYYASGSNNPTYGEDNPETRVTISFNLTF